MATKTESNAPASSNQSGANFTQQGSLDWVALGRMQYSTSVAVLARLSKAGIDPLTLAVGQCASDCPLDRTARRFSGNP